MNHVTVVGLGKMGTALAEAFLRAQLKVTVWNRTQLRSTPLAARGASVALSLSDAIVAADVIVICLSDYAAWDALASDPDISGALAGRTVIQLSSGTPQQARDGAARADAQGIAYLDGAVLAAPSSMGTQAARILVSGSQAVFEAKQALLAALGSVRFVGQSPGAAAALDCAALTNSMMSIVALIHGIAVCESEGVDPAQLVAMTTACDSARTGYMRAIAAAISGRNYDETQASLATWAAVAHHLNDISATNHVAADVPELLCGLFDRAIGRGFGDKDIAALMEVIRADLT